MDFKAFVDNVASKAGSLAKSAAKKTGEVTESAKYAIMLKTEQNKLEGMYTTLGKLFYEQAKGTDIRAQVAAQVMEIDEQKQIIADLKATISENSGKIICEGCGKEIDIDNAFCPDCGKKVEPKLLHDKDEEVTEDVTCDESSISEE